MDIHSLTEAMMDAARNEKNDEKSVILSRTAARLEHSGALFEAPLTADEIAIINAFMKGLSRVS